MKVNIRHIEQLWYPASFHTLFLFYLILVAVGEDVVQAGTSTRRKQCLFFPCFGEDYQPLNADPYFLLFSLLKSIPLFNIL